MEKTKEPLIFVKIHLQSTEECLCELSSETYYKIGSVFETINGIDCIVKLDGNEFCIAAKNLNTNLKKQPYLYQRVCYGFCEQFALLNAKTSYLVEKGVKDFRMNPSEEYAYKGGISEFKPLLSNAEQQYFFRCLFEYPSTLEANLISYFVTSPFETEKIRSAGGLLRICVENTSFNIFLSKINNDNFLVLDALDKCDYERFEKIINAISLNYQLLSGVKVKGRRLILRSENIEFHGVTLHSFKKLKTDISNFTSLLRPRDLLDFYPFLKKEERYMDKVTFQKLVEQSLNDKRIIRAISMIVSSYELPIEIKASNYCVALETFKDVILSENPEKVNPIRDKKISDEIRGRFKEVIEEYSETVFNNKEVIISKINNFNQTTNADGFLKMFELVNIQLQEHDQTAISKRNDFLHGRVPLESSDGDDKELYNIVYRLHFLLMSLILKKSGFCGYLLELVNIHVIKEGKSPFRLV